MRTWTRFSLGSWLRMIGILMVAGGAVCSSGCGNWNVAAPSSPYQFGSRIPYNDMPHRLAAVVTLGPPPKTVEDSYRIMLARCQASESEKKNSLNTYRAFKWILLPVGLASSSAAVALSAINDPSTNSLGDSARTQMRVWSVVSGSVGVLLSTIYGLVGFDTRIDATTRDLVSMRTAMDKARSRWSTAASEERRELLLDLAGKCNSEERIEQIVAGTNNRPGFMQKIQAAYDDIGDTEETIRDIQKIFADKPSDNDKESANKKLAELFSELRSSILKLAQDLIMMGKEGVISSNKLTSELLLVDGIVTTNSNSLLDSEASIKDAFNRIQPLLNSARQQLNSLRQQADPSQKTKSSTTNEEGKTIESVSAFGRNLDSMTDERRMAAPAPIQ